MLDEVRGGSKARMNVCNDEWELLSGRFGCVILEEDGKGVVWD